VRSFALICIAICVAACRVHSYDWEILRGQLEARGYKFRSHSDSEVPLAMYVQQGINMVRELRGEFAIAIVDENQGVCHFVRDRFGIKPLYYARHGGRWLFASEMKALFALGVPARWNVNNIAGCSQVWAQGPCFAGIQSVPPGHYATLTRDGHMRLTRYWDAEYGDRNVPDTRTDEEMIGGVRSRLIEAVRTRLRSDVPVAVYLSGGLDSCATLGIASSLSSNPLTAFTISFSQTARFDEFATAQAQAKMSGAKFHRVEVTEDQLADNFEKSIYHCEQAVFNVSGVAKFMLSKVVRDAGVKVVLTGEGSDEIFAGQ
jgi:asparagine synthase (glutamine-hydrolysing)